MSQQKIDFSLVGKRLKSMIINYGMLHLTEIAIACFYFTMGKNHTEKVISHYTQKISLFH